MSININNASAALRINTIFLLVLLFSRPAGAIDLTPGDLVAPPPDVALAQLSYHQIQRGDYYFGGKPLIKGSRLTIQQWQIRLGHSIELAGRPGFVYIETPMVSIETGGVLATQPGDRGVGDTSLMLAIWPYSDHSSKTYVALGAYAQIPTGSYRSTQNFNVGFNRYSAALQAGFQTGLTDNLDAIVAVDGVWFGANNEFGAQNATQTQDLLSTVQGGFRYKMNDRYGLATNAIYSSGGETKINGQAQKDPIHLSRYQLTAYANYSFGRLSLQYGSDLETRNGFFEERRWIVRYRVFY